MQNYFISHKPNATQYRTNKSFIQIKKYVFHTRNKKKGVPLYSNLINLKSNTMKNTLQIYTLLIY